MELRQYLDQHDLTIADFARLINVSSRMTVFRYLSRKRVPAPYVMARIVAATDGKVQPNDFYGSQGTEVRDQGSDDGSGLIPDPRPLIPAPEAP